MEVLFENTYVRNREAIKEIYAKIQFLKPLSIIFDIYMAIITIFMVLISILTHNLNFNYFLFLILYLFLRFFRFYRSVNLAMKGDAEINNGQPVQVTSSVTDSAIVTVASTGSRLELPLDRINYIKQSKNFILIYSKAKYAWVLRKDGFSVGSYEEFLNFISAKGIKIK